MPAHVKSLNPVPSSDHALGQSYFVSPEVFAREQERIFSTHWLCVGHLSQLQHSADFFLAEASGESMVILRDETGETTGCLISAAIAPLGCVGKKAAIYTRPFVARTMPGLTRCTGGSWARLTLLAT